MLMYEKKHYIYLTINLENGKVYVGYHFGYVDDRYFGSGKIILKVDKKKLTKVILEIVNEENWAEREVYWIKHFDSTNKKIGYNIDEGGCKGTPCSGSKNGMFGRTHTDEVKAEQSRRTKELYKNEPERLLRISIQHKGKKVSDEFREKRRKIMMGNKPKNRKRCMYDGVEYECLTHLAEFLGMSKSGISDRAKDPKWGITIL